MINDEILPNQKVFVVKGKNNSQVGSGLRLITVTVQTDSIKRRRKSNSSQSSRRRLSNKIRRKIKNKIKKKLKRSKKKVIEGKITKKKLNTGFKKRKR